MTVRDRFQKNLLFFTVGAYYLGGYFFINVISASRPDLHTLILPGERALPFVPHLIFAYLLVFAYIALIYLAVDDLPYFRKVSKAFFLCVTIHFIFFLIFPVEYVLRPEVRYEWGGIYKLVVFYYWVDLPYNCFPSMHISNVFLVSFMLERYRHGWGKFLFPLATLVAISVVVVKQHYVADVIAGFFVGWGTFRLVFGNAQTRVVPLLPERH